MRIICAPSSGGITISGLSYQFITPSGSYVNSNSYNGPCPVTMSYVGTITDNVGNRDITARIITSSGSPSPGQVIHFDQPGESHLLSGYVADIDINDESFHQGWFALEILQPVQLQSNRLEHQITCTPGTGAAPQTLQAENDTTAATTDDAGVGETGGEGGGSSDDDGSGGGGGTGDTESPSPPATTNDDEEAGGGGGGGTGGGSAGTTTEGGGGGIDGGTGPEPPSE
jgi:hypothetical protein